VWLVPAAFAGQTPTHTNILLIVTDDQRWDELGVVQREIGESARFRFLKTPRLDALAAQGMRFRNAFVTTSLCSPSRAAILTGQYNHTNGILDNNTYFTARPTWATELQAAGYSTAYFGKWHHSNQVERPGFDYVATYLGHGKYIDATFKVNDEWVETAGYIDERSVDYAIEYLESQQDKPFAVMIGLKAPHQPVIPMADHAQNYLEDSITLPPSWNVVQPYSRAKFPRGPKVRKWWLKIARPQTINGIDLNVGRMLDALDRLGLADNTLVIFTSDNGYQLGEHNVGDKRTAYEESIRVPLIVRLPGVVRAGSISDAMVLNIDLAPTLLDFTQQHSSVVMQGESLQSLLLEKPTAWREAFLYEYWPWRGDRSPYLPPAILAVRTASHKLVMYPDHEDWTELFDLNVDQHETHNLADYKSSAKLMADMCARLQQLIVETGYISRPWLNKWLPESSLMDSRYRLNSKTDRNAIHPPLAHANC
jgi:arylsulfatase A-like enzyme